MQRKLQSRLLIASGAIGAVILAILVMKSWFPAVHSKKDTPDKVIAQGDVSNRSELSDPPPAPKAVANPDRVRQNLRPGKTYVTHTKGTLNVRGEDKSWGFGTVVTINYAFEAHIDRTIESNNGTQIVELRYFRDLRSLKVDTRLEDIRLDLGGPGEALLLGLAKVFNLPSAFAATAHAVDGTSLKPALQALRWAGVSPESIGGLDDKSVKMFAQVDQLSGKKVRLTYEDGRGVQKVEAVAGEMTADERRFHFASVLLSDSLIIPDVDIKIGNTWSVDGSNFANLIDPGLLSQAGGEVILKRADDHIVQNKTCRHVAIESGRITIDDSNAREGRIGHFEPKGSLYFSTEDQIVVQARLRGTAKLERFSKNHLLFESRMRRLPELELIYTCSISDTPKADE